ncbi:MATE family efflux transporter [Macrococcus bovicus]|uniref:MATE family efflux transporter n=1 Tax=Macrococcus bovicus TaxID=69968 RepID=UPI0025A515D3|nr:MATE family efflux transporter [Macrococcus bovicus]WJP97876.1 MATE family efflux transporter [Macrococcus bovicus]
MKDEQLYYFEKAPIGQSILHFSLPMIIAMLLSVVYGILNIYFIGFLNNSHMIAAITLATPVFALQMGIGNLMGVGGGTFISRLLGNKQYRETKKVASVVIYISAILGLLTLALTLPFTHQIALFLGATGKTLTYTTHYLFIMLLGTPAVILFFALEQLMRAEGSPMMSMVGMVASVLINMILDPIFIFGFHLDIRGAALGTLISNIVAIIIYMVYIQRKSSVLSLKFSDFKPSDTMLQEIMKIGIPAFLMSVLMGFSGLVLNMFLTSYGNSAVAAYGIQFKLIQFPELIVMGLCEGVVPLIAYNYMSNKQRMKQAVWYIIGTIVVLVGLSMAVVIFFGTPIVSQFTNDPHIIAEAVFMLKITSASLFMNGIGFMLIGMMQAAGLGRASMIMAVSPAVIIIVVINIMNSLFQLNGVIWTFFISEALVALLAMAIVYFMRDEFVVDTDQLIEE